MSMWQRIAAIVLAWLLGGVALAQAPARAWLDRDRVELGESVTLNVESYARAGQPDFSVLERDFDLRGSSSRTETSISAGQAQTRRLWAVVLEPRREGVTTIPALDIGDERSEPLTLTVLPPRLGSVGAEAPVFMETAIEDDTPYVGQAVVYLVRLLYRVTLLEGQLDAPEPDGAALRRLGEDQTSFRMIEGHRYNLVERRYLLLPERSGELEVPPARFRGRGLTGRGLRGDQALSAAGEAYTLRVRPRPTPPGQPWLPARDLELDYADLPSEARAGEPFTLTLRLRADGLAGEQLPDIDLPEIEGAQVYPEAPQFLERVRDGRPQLEWTRRFALVVNRPGELTLPPLQLGWWSLAEDSERQAELAGHALRILPAGALSPAPTDPGIDPGPMGAPAPAPAEAAPSAGFWPWLSLALALGWAASLGWLLRWRRSSVPRRGTSAGDAPRGDAVALRRALASGDLEAINRALEALAPTGQGLAGLLPALADPEQIEAVRALQAARWGQGDPALARERLGRAFRGGPRWSSPNSEADEDLPLPPHYPRH